MKCPYCGQLGDKVVDSRESKEGDVIRRRRQCLSDECGKRFTTAETVTVASSTRRSTVAVRPCRTKSAATIYSPHAGAARVAPWVPDAMR